MAKASSVWAIDVGQAALKALKLVPDDATDSFIAEAFDYIEYPKILSQPDADAEELVHEALTTFVGRNELKGSKVAVGVPGQAGLVKFIKLPPVEKKRIPDIVKFEARQQIPFPLEEVIWDYQQIGSDADDGEEFTMAEVGLFAMKRDQIQRAILPLKRAGVEVDLVQMGPIALFNYLVFDRRLDEAGATADGANVLIDIGADHTDLIITDGKRIWQRNVPIGGNHFTRALTKELKLTFAKAEHLKKNATKAPDPKAVFTAMRGIFSDFAGEVNRSIGFYGSINRGAKIARVVGLGNGFKLPGLQKFLEQNLGHPVEKIEQFNRLVGEDVIRDPRFQENLPSFAVAYGLAVQGMGEGPLRTNLLPPEITQARMVRKKKPWALAAAVLLMVGFSAMYLGDWRVWAKVASKDFDSAVSAAKTATSNGERLKADYDKVKTDFNGKKDEGNLLVTPKANRAIWPQMLIRINRMLPNPIEQYKLDPTDPKNAQAISSLRLHIDEIVPAWREDLDAEWYSLATDWQKRLMHPIDKAEGPKGAGWVVQIVGHHFNPYQTTEEDFKVPADKQTKFGPMRYLLERVLPPIATDPELRQFGFSHYTLAWLRINKEWTPDATAGSNGLTGEKVPLLARAERAVSAEGGEGMMGPGMGMMPGMMEGYGGSGMMGPGSGMMGPGMGGMPGYGGMMGMPGYGGMGTSKDAQDRITKLTRCDFMIQFAWIPASEENPAKELNDIIASIRKAEAEALGKEDTAKAEDLENAVNDASAQLSDKASQPPAAAAGAAPAPGQAAPAPGGAPNPSGAAPGGAATPAPAGAAPAQPAPTAPAAPGNNPM